MHRAQARGVDKGERLERGVGQKDMQCCNLSERKAQLVRQQPVVGERPLDAPAVTKLYLEPLRMAVVKPRDQLRALADVRRRDALAEERVDERGFAAFTRPITAMRNGSCSRREMESSSGRSEAGTLSRWRSMSEETASPSPLAGTKPPKHLRSGRRQNKV